MSVPYFFFLLSFLFSIAFGATGKIENEKGTASAPVTTEQKAPPTPAPAKPTAETPTATPAPAPAPTTDNTVVIEDDRRCRTVVDVGDFYIGSRGGGHAGRGTSGGYGGYGASGGRGRGTSVSTPYGGVRMGAHKECPPPPVIVVQRAPQSTPTTTTAPSAPAPEIARLQRDLAKSDARIAELKAIIAESEGDNKALIERLAELEAENAELRGFLGLP